MVVGIACDVEAAEQESGTQMFLRRRSALALACGHPAFATASRRVWRDLDIPFDAFDVGEAARRIPQFAESVIDRRSSNPPAGVLLARQSLLALVALFERRGGIVACGEALRSKRRD